MFFELCMNTVCCANFLLLKNHDVKQFKANTLFNLTY